MLGPLCALLLLWAAPARAQIDPTKRRLIHAGFDRAWEGPAPAGAYIFYYINQPRFVRDDLTLRLALAPVYMDSELGVGGDQENGVAVGLAGGGFADGYSEVRGGHHYREESFNGNGGTVSFSFYRALNHGNEIPISVVARAAAHLAAYGATAKTSDDFVKPPDHGEYSARLGLRVGGVPPELLPARAGEVSFWYVPYLRDREGDYGYRGDRRLNRVPQLFWTRFTMAYRLESDARFDVTAQAGGSRDADRLSAYRLGGMLPFASEFPLALAGYYNGELSADRYALFGGRYIMPLDPTPNWYWSLFAQSANIHFLPGLDQPKPWNSAVGTGLEFLTKDGSLTICLDFGYAVDAIRSGGRGAESLALTMQLDLEALARKTRPKRLPRVSPTKQQGAGWLGRLLTP
jgi:hypothetical protein